MSTQDDDRIRTMSPEEIAALDDNDYDAEADNAAALAEMGRGAIEDDDQGDDGADDVGGEDEAVDKDSAGDDAAAEAGSEDAEKPAESDVSAEEDAKVKDPAPEPTPKPSSEHAGYSADLPEDYDAQVKANKEAVAALRKRFNDGAVEAAEYEAQLDALHDKRSELERIKTRAEISEEMAQQSRHNAWISTIHAFAADAASKPEMGLVDYAKDMDKQADLDVFVKALAGIKGNENKPMRWFLEEAHKRVLALHGIAPAQSTPPAQDKKPQQATRKADASKVVQGLAEVPGGASDADPSSDEFADLDKLTGLDYERALSALPEDKRRRYLMSA